MWLFVWGKCLFAQGVRRTLRGASEPTFHGPGGSRGGFMEVVIPAGGAGIVQMREAVINYWAQTIQYTYTPAKLITGLP